MSKNRLFLAFLSTFVRNLMAIFHTRVGYPSREPDPKRPDLFEADQFPKFH